MKKRLHEKVNPKSSMELNENAFIIYEKIIKRIDELELNGGSPTNYKTIVDFTVLDARRIWSEINKISRSKNFSPEKVDYFVDILTNGTDTSIYGFNEFDKRARPKQLEELKLFGRDVGTLYRKLTHVKSGVLLEFAEDWRNSLSSENLDDDIFIDSRSNYMVNNALFFRSEIKKNVYPFYSFLLLLKSFAEFASKYDASKSDRHSIGLKSQKTSAVTYFVIQMHNKFFHTLGKPCHNLNAHLASLLLKERVSSSRVEEIVSAARKRGEISPQKTKKSPPL